MITNIALENFKCFPSVNIDPKLITVLIGPNGTVKSAILQALLLLKQSHYSNNPRIRARDLTCRARCWTYRRKILCSMLPAGSRRTST